MRRFCKHLEDRITIADIKICCQLGNSYQEKSCFDVYQQIPTYEDGIVKEIQNWALVHKLYSNFI